MASTLCGIKAGFIALAEAVSHLSDNTVQRISPEWLFEGSNCTIVNEVAVFWL